MSITFKTPISINAYIVLRCYSGYDGGFSDLYGINLKDFKSGYKTENDINEMNKEDQDLIIKNGEPRSGIFLNKPAYYVGIENLVNAKQLWSLRDFLRYMKDYFLKEDKEKKDKLFKKHLIESVDINIDELKNDTYLPFDIENLMSILKKIDGHSYVETDSDALFKVYIYSGTERCSILKNLNVEYFYSDNNNSLN